MKLVSTIFILIGSLFMISGLLFSPWITVLSASEFEQRRLVFASRLDQLSPVSQTIPLIEEFRFAHLREPQQMSSAYPVEQYGTLYSQIAYGNSISAWSLLMDIPITDMGIKVLIVILLILLTLHPLYLLTQWVGISLGMRPVRFGFMVIDSLVLLFAFATVHAIDNLGIFHRPDLATLRMLSVMRLAAGYPLTVVGLLFNGLGVTFAYTPPLQKRSQKNVRHPSST